MTWLPIPVTDSPQMDFTPPLPATNLTYTLTYANYDSLNRPGQQTYPDGETLTLTYDHEGADQLTSTVQGQLIADLAYNARGQQTLLDRVGTADTHYSYYPQTGTPGTGNSNFRLQQMQSGNLLHFSYAYDTIGNLSQITDHLLPNDPNQQFTYDHLQRLTAAWTPAGAINSYNHSYSYDLLGNLSDFDGAAYSYHPVKKHAVTAIPATSSNFGYDNNGNMTSRTDPSGSYVQNFDVENRLTSLTQNGTATTSFAYDADGIRVKTVQPDGSLLRTPFPFYEVQSQVGSTTSRTSYLFAGQPVALRVKVVSFGGGSDTLYYLYSDHLGSQSVVSTATGSELSGSRARYLPFGGWRTEPSTLLSNRGFTGHQQNNLGSGDTDLGLIYMNARYYLPNIGRFLSADTLVPDPQNPQSFNRYSYVLNNPLKFVDPSGHCRDIPDSPDSGSEQWSGICLQWMYEHYGIIFNGNWIQQNRIVWAVFVGLETMYSSLGGTLFKSIYGGLQFNYGADTFSFRAFAEANGVDFFGTDFQVPEVRKAVGILDSYTHLIGVVIHELAHYLVNPQTNNDIPTPNSQPLPTNDVTGFFPIYESFKSASGWEFTANGWQIPRVGYEITTTPYAAAQVASLLTGSSFFILNPIAEDAAESLTVSILVGTQALHPYSPNILNMLKTTIYKGRK